MLEQDIERYKTTTIPMELGIFLRNPYSRTFNNIAEANAYASKLKTKILPAIKELIASYQDHGPTTETLEF